MFKWRIFGFLAVVLLGVAFGGCKGQPKEKCLFIGGGVEIKFIYPFYLPKMKLSPLEKGKIWIWGNNNKIFEIDVNTHQEIFLSSIDSGRLIKIFDTYQYEEDPFEDYVWIYPTWKNLRRYNRGTKRVDEFPVKQISEIIPTADHLYFFSKMTGTIYNYDRKTGQVQKDTAIKVGMVESMQNIDNKSMIINREYTYDLLNRKLIKGVYVGGRKMEGDYFYYKNGILVEAIADSFSIESTNGFAKKYYFPGYNHFVIDSPFVWVFNTGDIATRIDVGEGGLVKYPTYIPQLFKGFSVQQFAGEYIWLYSDQQFHLFNKTNGNMIEYPIAANQELREVAADDCNIYLLYKDHLTIFGKQEFIKQCKPFDSEKFQAEWVAFEKDADALGMGRTPDMNVVAKNLQELKEKYKDIDNIQIDKMLKWFELHAFANTLKKPSDYISGFRDKTLPLLFRMYCFNFAIENAELELNFNDVLSWDKQYREELVPTKQWNIQHLGNPVSWYMDKGVSPLEYKFNNNGRKSLTFSRYGYIEGMDAMRKYMNAIDSVKNIGVPIDHLAFAKAELLYDLCLHGWAGARVNGDFTSMKRELKSFIKTYPESKYADNAAFQALQCDHINYFDYEYGLADDLVKKYVEGYKAILSKYPDTELKADIAFEIYQLYVYSDSKKAIALGKQFVKDFPNDKRVKEVLDEINQ